MPVLKNILFYIKTFKTPCRLEDFSIFPVDAGRKLNVHKTFRRRPGRLLNVLCTFNLRPVSTGSNALNLVNLRVKIHNCVLF